MDLLSHYLIRLSCCALLFAVMMSFQQIASAQKNIPGGKTHQDALSSPKPFASGVKKLGAITSFAVSTSVWKAEGHGEGPIAYSYLWSYIKDSDVTLNISWRGPRLSEAVGKSASAILAQQPHKLTAAEIRALGNVMRYANGFNFITAQTKNLGGARVIAVSGTHSKWGTDHSALHEDAVFIKSSDDGQVFQKVSVTGPSSRYGEYKKDAMSALNGLHLVSH